jgi:hypothetical protein
MIRDGEFLQSRILGNYKSQLLLRPMRSLEATINQSLTLDDPQKQQQTHLSSHQNPAQNPQPPKTKQLNPKK